MALDKLVDSSQLNSDLTSVANAIRTKGGTSAQLAFPQGFVSAVQAIPSGGGGATVLSSGSISGNDNYYITVNVGTKMAQTNFVFEMWLDDETELAYDSNYKVASLAVVIDGNLVKYDLSSTGTKTATALKRVVVNNNGTTTNVSVRAVLGSIITIRNNAVGNTMAAVTDKVTLTRNASNFTISYNQNNSIYKFVSGKTYNWRLLYFGSDPQNDIVEVT